MVKMTKQITGEHFVIRANGTYINPVTCDVSPASRDLITFPEMPSAEDMEEARLNFADLRERDTEVGISYGVLQVVHETRLTRRILGVPLSRWRVVETIPIAADG